MTCDFSEATFNGKQMPQLAMLEQEAIEKQVTFLGDSQEQTVAASNEDGSEQK